MYIIFIYIFICSGKKERAQLRPIISQVRVTEREGLQRGMVGEIWVVFGSGEGKETEKRNMKREKGRNREGERGKNIIPKNK